nr:PAS domain S-box protein [Conexibacter arvalis]
MPSELLEVLLRSIADAVYLVDRDGLVRFVNPAALEVLGYDEPAELLGAPSHATIHFRRPDGSPYPESECPLLLPRTTGRTVRVEDDWFVRRDGSMVPVAYSSAPIPEQGGGRGAVVAFRDTSERRAAEAAARREAAERARAEELQQSRARIVAAADAERRRLGRDIHDGAQQRLMNVALGVQAGLAALPGEAEEARAALDDALAEVRAAISDLRELAAGIHPSILTNRGLEAAVDSLTGRMPLPTRFEVPARRWAPAVEAAAYFVIAEALANAAKHARASRAEVRVAEREGRLLVTVFDDGRGGAVAAPGRGLQGLHDRVGAAGGTLTVDSPSGGPTTVTADLPATPAA